MNIRLTIVLVLISFAAMAQQFQPLWLIQWQEDLKNGYVPVTTTFNSQTGVQQYFLMDSIVHGDLPNFYYVSPFGVDSTARVGEPDRPWRTPWSARAAAENESVIIVAPGKYTQGTDFVGAANLAGKELTYFFYDGAEVYTTAGPVMNFENEPIKGTSIYGKARFVNITANASGRFFSSSSGAPDGNKALVQAKSIHWGGSGGSVSTNTLAFVRNDYDLRIDLDSLVIDGNGGIITGSGSTQPNNYHLDFYVNYFEYTDEFTISWDLIDLYAESADVDIHFVNNSFHLNASQRELVTIDNGAGSVFDDSRFSVQIDSGSVIVDQGAIISVQGEGTGSKNILDFDFGNINITGTSGGLVLGCDSDNWGQESKVEITGENVVLETAGRMFFNGMDTNVDHLAQYIIDGRFEASSSMLFIPQQMEIEISGEYTDTNGGSIFPCLGATSGGEIVFRNVTANTLSGTWISTDQPTFPVTFINVENNPESRTANQIDVNVYELSPYISVHGDIAASGEDSIFTAQFLAENMSDATSNEIRIGHDIDSTKNYLSIRHRFDSDNSNSNVAEIDFTNTTQGDIRIHADAQLQAPTLFDSVASRKVYKDNEGYLWSSETSYALVSNGTESISTTSGVADTLTLLSLTSGNDFSVVGGTIVYNGTTSKVFKMEVIFTADFSASTDIHARLNRNDAGNGTDFTRRSLQSGDGGQPVSQLTINTLDPGDYLTPTVTVFSNSTLEIITYRLAITEI